MQRPNRPLHHFLGGDLEELGELRRHFLGVALDALRFFRRWT